MRNMVRKTTIAATVFAVSALTAFTASASDMADMVNGQASVFQGTGGTPSMDVPDMSGNLFGEMSSGTDLPVDSGTSVEMPDIGSAQDTGTVPDMGSLEAASDNTATDEKKDESVNALGSAGSSLSTDTKTDNPFSSLGDSVVGNLSFDADGYLSQLMGDSYGGINSSLFNMEMPDVSFSDLNSQFAQMKASMDLKTSSISMELPEFTLNTTSATNAKDLFSQTYGDLTKGMGVKNYSIPSGFDTNAFLQKGFSAQADMKKAYEGSTAFKNANSYIGGASDIVKEATGKLDTTSAFDRIGELQTKLNGSKSKVDSMVPDATFENTGVGDWVDGKRADIKEKNDTAYQNALADLEKKKNDQYGKGDDDTTVTASDLTDWIDSPNLPEGARKRFEHGGLSSKKDSDSGSTSNKKKKTVEEQQAENREKKRTHH